jgi:hypothetical protein
MILSTLALLLSPCYNRAYVSDLRTQTSAPLQPGLGILFLSSPVSTTAALPPSCHSERPEEPRAMAVPVDWAKGTVRFLVGRGTTAQEIVSEAVRRRLAELKR